MDRELSLAHLTVISLPPPEMIRVAARTGYQSVGLRLIRVTPESPGYSLMDNGLMRRETLLAMKGTQIKVHDIEFVKITPELDISSLKEFCAVGAELGASRIIAAPYDPDLAGLADKFAALCDLAADYNLGVVLEFFPWTNVPTLKDALEIRRRAGEPKNGGVLVDSLHFFRSKSNFSDLEHLNADTLPFLHLCDGPLRGKKDMGGRLFEARAERLPPGKGELPLAELIKRMPSNIPISLEVPMEHMAAEKGPEAVAQYAHECAVHLLKSMEPSLC